MGASVQAHAYVLCVIATLPLIYARKAYRVSSQPPDEYYRISSVWASLWLIVYVYLLRKIVVPFYFSPLRHLPQPKGDWFALGHGPALVQRPPGFSILRAIKKTPNQGMLLVRSFFFSRQLVVLTSPEALGEVLTTRAYDFVKPREARDFLEHIVGEGLIIVEGAQHKQQRRAVTPAFQGRTINGLVPVFWRKSLEFVETVSREMAATANGKYGTIEISAPASRVTLDIIGLASLGVDFGTLQNADDELAADYSILTDPANRRLGLHAAANSILGKFAGRALMPGTSRLIRTTCQRLRVTCRRLLAEKRATLQDKTASTSHGDIVTTLMNNGSMTDDELVNQLLTFLAAGHETTASAMTWACYELTRHKDVQERLRAEVRSKVDFTNADAFDVNVLDSLGYLNGVCMETLRLWATVPVTSRIAVRDTPIRGQTIPKGSQIIIAPCAINKLDTVWGPDALEFKPERWLRQDGNLHGGSSSPYGMITFLHGPRSCIGQGFAKNELKCLMAAMVNRFEIDMEQPTDKIPVGGVITIKPRDGLVLKLRDLRGLDKEGS